MSLTSLHDKEISTQIAQMPRVSFYGIMLALIERAGSMELERLESVFPEAVMDARIRYHAPDGCLNIEEWEHKNKDDGGTQLIDRELLKKLFDQAREKAALR